MKEEAYEWGCFVGNHTGYSVVRAGGSQEAIDDYVPAFLRSRATAYRVTQIRARDLYDMRTASQAQRRVGRARSVRPDARWVGTGGRSARATPSRESYDVGTQKCSSSSSRPA